MSQSFKTQKSESKAKEPRKRQPRTFKRFKKPPLKRLLIYTTLALFVLSFVLLATTLYQVQVEWPSDEDYHMGHIQEGKYEWHSRNAPLSWLGFACFLAGVVAVAIFLATQSLKPNKG